MAADAAELAAVLAAGASPAVRADAVVAACLAEAAARGAAHLVRINLPAFSCATSGLRRSQPGP
ncbi:MAG: cyclodeaminase/cyclohydrolase family protein, partial [Solirubrobacteraceae bacterium]